MIKALFNDEIDSKLELAFIVGLLCLITLPPIYYLYKFVWINGHDRYWISYTLGYIFLIIPRCIIYNSAFKISRSRFLDNGLGVAMGIIIALTAALCFWRYVPWILSKLPLLDTVTAFTFGLTLLFGPFFVSLLPAILLILFFLGNGCVWFFFI